MSVKELFQAGKLDEAVEAQIKQVKSKPTSTEFRTLLFELLSFQGQLERADKQLEVIAQQDENANWATQVYRNLIKAETDATEALHRRAETRLPAGSPRLRQSAPGRGESAARTTTRRGECVVGEIRKCVPRLRGNAQ